MNGRNLLAAPILLIAAMLTGCASGTIGPERDINDPTNSKALAKPLRFDE